VLLIGMSIKKVVSLWCTRYLQLFHPKFACILILFSRLIKSSSEVRIW
jgi:hypothetical protein